MIARRTMLAVAAGILATAASGCAPRTPSGPSDTEISATIENAVDAVNGVASSLVEYKTVQGMGASLRVSVQTDPTAGSLETIMEDVLRALVAPTAGILGATRLNFFVGEEGQEKGIRADAIGMDSQPSLDEIRARFS